MLVRAVITETFGSIIESHTGNILSQKEKSYFQKIPLTHTRYARAMVV